MDGEEESVKDQSAQVSLIAIFAQNPERSSFFVSFSSFLRYFLAHFQAFLTFNDGFTFSDPLTSIWSRPTMRNKREEQR